MWKEPVSRESSPAARAIENEERESRSLALLDVEKKVGGREGLEC